MKTNGTRRPAARIRPPEIQVVTPREQLQGMAKSVEQNHRGVCGLSAALDEIEFGYARFSSEEVENCARSAIVDALRAICKFQGRDIKELINELNQTPAAEK